MEVYSNFEGRVLGYTEVASVQRGEVGHRPSKFNEPRLRIGVGDRRTLMSRPGSNFGQGNHHVFC